MKVISNNYTQRADLTFKHNITTPSRHSWLRLTPAYSVKLVQELLSPLENKQLKVFDPFSGTATTTLVAAQQGYEAVSTDINPFLVWLGNVKLARYSNTVLEEVIGIGKQIEADHLSIKPVPPPPISFIERWWSDDNLKYLCSIKAGIDKYRSNQNIYNLLLVAFCRTLIEISNASFGHQSISFKKKENIDERQSLWDDDSLCNQTSFLDSLLFVVNSVGTNPITQGRVILSDSRSLVNIEDNYFDIVITSPPYPNRMSYIRELRPYMYWLSYLVETQEAGNLDWKAIGGTWGLATSKLKEWKYIEDSFLTQTLQKTIQGIEYSDSKSSMILSKYISKYFYDMYQHFSAIYKKVKQGAQIHYIIGNSKFFDTLVPAEVIYSEFMEIVGFQDVQINILRKRNSKKELYEYDVVAYKR